MTKFCAINVKMKRPTTSTVQMLATASNGVSSSCLGSGADSTGGVMAGSVFFVVILSLYGWRLLCGLPQSLKRFRSYCVPKPLLPSGFSKEKSLASRFETLNQLRNYSNEQHEKCASSAQMPRGVPRVPCRVRVYHPRPVEHPSSMAAV